jgi:hypothetical protein
MKKITVILLSLALTLSMLPGCSSKEVAETQPEIDDQIEAVAEQPEQDPAEEAEPQEPDTAPEIETVSYSEASDTQEAQQEPEAADEAQEPEEEQVDEEIEPEEQTKETEQEPEISLFDICNETVYATSTVNIRAWYSTDSDKLGSLSYGQSIVRIGTGKVGTEAEGWSKVEFNGGEAYIYSEYISTIQPVTTSTSNSSNKQSCSQNNSQSNNNSYSNNNSNNSTQSDFNRFRQEDEEWLSKQDPVENQKDFSQIEYNVPGSGSAAN